ncbi:hypothetical protein BC628DRAFT_744917 [Trametes gibbosa]|nr:hypothetical protein BC628DRAFT_744917 [Trametes gibbosa]
MVRDSSPLTSFTSGSEQGSLSGHSQRKKTQERQMSAQPPPTESSAALPADEMDIIEVEYSDSDIKPRTVLYVYVPPMPKYTSERKRTFSSSGGSTQHVRKKPKSIEPSGPDHVHSEDDSPPRSRVVRFVPALCRRLHSDPALQSNPDDAPSRSDMDAVVADNRSALQLAAMLQQANDNRPVFSEVRPIVQKAKCKPVSVVQDIEDTSPPPISKPAAPGIAPDMNLAYPDKEDDFTPSVSGVATTSSLNTSGRTLHPPLPRTTTTKRVRATALPESDGPTSGRTTTVASADAGPAAKRRKGPPGIPLKEMAKRRGLDQDEGTSATKTKKSMAAVPLPHEGPSSRTLPRNGSDSRQLTANVPAVRQALSVSGRGSSTKRPQGSHATQSPAMYLLPAANTPQSSAAVCAAIASAAPTDDAHPQSSAATTKAKGSRTHEGSHSQPSPPESSAVTVPSTSVFTPVLPQPAVQVPSKPDDPAANLLNAFQAWVTVGTTASIEASRTQDLDKRLTEALESSAILSSAIEAIQSEQASQTERLVALQEKYAVQEAENAKMREQIQQTSHALARVNLELKETSKEGRLTQVQLTAERARTNGLLLEVEQKAAQLRALTEKAKEESAQLRALDEKVVHLEAALATSQVPPGLTRENVVELVSKMLDAQKAEVAERQPAMSTSGMIFTAMPIGTPMRAPSQELQQNTSYCQVSRMRTIDT